MSAVSAGAEGKRVREVATLALLCICALATTACREGSHAPTHLLDGAVAAAPPVNLEGVSGRVLQTAVHVVPDVLRSRDPAVRACLRQGSPRDGRGSAVVRVGVTGKSVTFRTAKGRALVACDGAQGRTVSWCGRAYGRLHDGRLRDPRLDLACGNASGKPLAFAWIEPSRRAKYVVVRHRAYAEAYRGRRRAARAGRHLGRRPRPLDAQPSTSPSTPPTDGACARSASRPRSPASGRRRREARW